MRLFIVFIALLISGCATAQNFVETAAITDAKATFPHLTSSQIDTDITIDHSAFDKFLTTYVENKSGSQVSRVRYGEVSEEDHALLSDYVKYLQTVKVTSLDRDEQLAFWINLYNAETIRTVLQAYPVSSIRAIKSHPLDFKGPWNDKRLNIEGTALTLDNIENRIIRPVFNDARIHYALNCAAMGCPNLREQAYTAKDIQAALDEQARAFINDPRGIKIEDGTVIASRIFLWYRDDYGRSENDVLDHIRRFARPELLHELEGVTSIDTYEYDWALNDYAGTHTP